MSTIYTSFRHRSLEHYPSNAYRIWYLALAVVATIILYYESYVLPSVAPLVLQDFKLSVSSYSLIVLVSNALGALSAIFGSLSDRIGRSNLIIYGLLITGIGTLVIALTNSLWPFLILIWVLGFIEGIILVVTPALVRDFSPRFGRALAMGFWTVGPVGGSVLATGVASQTLQAQGTWQSQYIIAGIVGLVVFLLCFFSIVVIIFRLPGAGITGNVQMALTGNPGFPDMSFHQHIIEVILLRKQIHFSFFDGAHPAGCCYPGIPRRVKGNIIHLIIHQPAPAEPERMRTIGCVPHNPHFRSNPYNAIG